MISTRDLSGLLPAEKLKYLTQSLSMLDAIIQQNRDYRYYFFNSKWSGGVQLASMNNGQGDSWFCTFSSDGAFLKGFDHESPMSPWSNEDHKIWPGVLDNVPSEFKRFTTEPEVFIDDTTFCIWQRPDDLEWRRGQISFPPGNDPDGSAHLLGVLDGNPQTYRQWAEEYYECAVSLSSVEHIYMHKPLTESIVQYLNPHTSLSDLTNDIAEISYPTE
jgi:hypothetical protein